jgi:hypothetical protein
MRRTRLLTAALGAIAVLATAIASPALANRLGITEKGFRITWVSMKNGIQSLPEFRAETVEIICNTTMEGSFHSSTIAKVARALIGYVTRVAVNSSSCREARGGSASFEFLTEGLPWHTTYTNFTGTLPVITRVGLSFIGMGLRIVQGARTCLARSTLTSPAGWFITREAGSGILSFTANEMSVLPFPLVGLGCTEYSMYYSGFGRFARLGTTTSVNLTLI